MLPLEAIVSQFDLQHERTKKSCTRILSITKTTFITTTNIGLHTETKTHLIQTNKSSLF